MNRKQFLLSIVAIPYTLDLLGANDEIGIDILTGRKTPILKFGLQAAASNSFIKMKKEAAKKGIQLHITSGHRDYTKQLTIWNNKFDRYQAKGLSSLDSIRKITEYSAMPGTSRHHWGTDADILDISVIQPKSPLNSNHYITSKGVYNKMYEWMLANAANFDFYEAYTNDTNRKGYEFEPWHYSFQPLSIDYLKKYNQVVSVENVLSPNLKGKEFITEEFFKDYKKEYINGINSKLMNKQ
jgi:LAS superfamily LD-carboxypeptidase LdcB